MNTRNLLLIVVTAAVLAAVTVVVLKQLGLSDVAVIAGGAVGGMSGALLGARLKRGG